MKTNKTKLPVYTRRISPQPIDIKQLYSKVRKADNVSTAIGLTVFTILAIVAFSYFG
jgi:hypothetical protein